MVGRAREVRSVFQRDPDQRRRSLGHERADWSQFFCPRLFIPGRDKITYAERLNGGSPDHCSSGETLIGDDQADAPVRAFPGLENSTAGGHGQGLHRAHHHIGMHVVVLRLDLAHGQIGGRGPDLGDGLVRQLIPVDQHHDPVSGGRVGLECVQRSELLPPEPFDECCEDDRLAGPGREYDGGAAHATGPRLEQLIDRFALVIAKAQGRAHEPFSHTAAR